MDIKISRYKITEKIILILFTCLAFLLFTGILVPWLIVQRKDITGEYIENSDDTVTVKINVKEKITLHIRGVKPSAENSGKIRELCKNARKLELKNLEMEKYFHVFADVYIDGKNLSDLLKIKS